MKDHSTNLILLGIGCTCFGGFMEPHHAASMSWFYDLCMISGLILAAVGFFMGVSKKQ
jgi:hypothetical protein